MTRDQNRTPIVKLVVQPPRSIFVAEEPRVGRHVTLGFLPPDFTTRDDRAERETDAGEDSRPGRGAIGMKRAGKIELSTSTNSPVSL